MKHGLAMAKPLFQCTNRYAKRLLPSPRSAFSVVVSPTDEGRSVAAIHALFGATTERPNLCAFFIPNAVFGFQMTYSLGKLSSRRIGLRL
jgi:hypothetical protein